MPSIIVFVPFLLPAHSALVDCLWGEVDLFELFRLESVEGDEPSFPTASNNSEYEIH